MRHSETNRLYVSRVGNDPKTGCPTYEGRSRYTTASLGNARLFKRKSNADYHGAAVQVEVSVEEIYDSDLLLKLRNIEKLEKNIRRIEALPEPSVFQIECLESYRKRLSELQGS